MFTRGNVLSILAMVTCCGALAITAPGTGRTQDARTATPPTNVLVTNTAASPVPVTGTLGLNGSANVVKAQQLGLWNVGVSNIPSVKQNGPWSVGLSSTANTVKLDAATNTVKSAQAGPWSVGLSPGANTVQVANPISSPVRVRDAGDSGMTFVRTVAFLIPDGSSGSAGSFAIPDLAPDQKLLIEHMSISGNLPDGQEIIGAELRTSNDDGAGSTMTAPTYLPTSLLGSSGGLRFFGGGQVTHIYHEPRLGALAAAGYRSSNVGSAYCQAVIHCRIVSAP